MGYHKSKRQFVQKLFFGSKSDFETESQLKSIISNALDDKMVAEDIDKKKGYRLEPLFDRKVLLNQTINDWYCFECHSSASNQQLIGCKSCFRSFHYKCLQLSGDSSDQFINDSNKPFIEESEDKSLNASTKGSNVEFEGQPNNGLVSTSNDEPNVDSEELCNETVEQSKTGSDNDELFTAFPLAPSILDFECRYCLQFKYLDNKSRAKEICGEELKLSIQLFLTVITNEFRAKDIDIYSQFSIESSLKTNSLLFYSMDLKVIQMKVSDLRNYRSFVEFENDLRHFFHCFVVLKGKELIQPFIDRIEREFRELYRCLDCYLWERAPNEARVPIDKWFLRVCNPPHRLVYAQVDGCPYWPSKVIRWDDLLNECEVQFFEPRLYRTAVVPIKKTKPIDYSLDSKRLATDPTLVESMAILYKHLKNLCNQNPELIDKDVFKRIEKRLAFKWRKNKFEFLMEFNFDSKTTVKTSAKTYGKSCCVNKSDQLGKKTAKRRFQSLKDSQELTAFKHFHCAGDSRDSQLSDDNPIDNNLVISEDTNSSVESEKTGLQTLLSDPEIREEAKFKICTLVISFLTDKQFNESQDIL